MTLKIRRSFIKMHFYDDHFMITGFNRYIPGYSYNDPRSLFKRKASTLNCAGIPGRDRNTAANPFEVHAVGTDSTGKTILIFMEA